MNVDITQMGAVYDALEANIVSTLTTEYDAGRLKGREYSAVMTAALNALITSCVTSVQEQPIKDAQVLDMKVRDFCMLANAQKDVELKDVEVRKVGKEGLFTKAKIDSMTLDDAIKQENSTADLTTKAKQLLLMAAQSASETSKATLYTAQKDFYNSQVELKVLESATNMLGMQAAGDMDLDLQMLGEVAAYINGKL